jgi:hypothetical protein
MKRDGLAVRLRINSHGTDGAHECGAAGVCAFMRRMVFDANLFAGSFALRPIT